MLALGLTGCIIPVIHKAGREGDTCGRLSEGLPSFIKVGETTRQQVLQELGTAAGTAPDESWLTYGCRVSQGGGGVWFGIPMGGGGGFESEQFLYKRLVVRFDATGTVSRADLEEKSCRMRKYGRPGRDTPPCIDLAGHDLLEVTALPFLTGEGAITIYEPIEWYDLWEKNHDRPEISGVLVISERSLMVRSGCDLRLSTPCDLRDTTTEVARLVYSDISAVAYMRYLLIHPVVLITPKHGDVHAFSVYGRGSELADGTRTKAAAEALRLRIEAATATNHPEQQ